ncbi:peptidoglycan-binding protein [uncultured Anaerococcus sp.]|uniref:peptidoglycan-binding protein n=1 Tax=uncultured Anaerococcus sp. TaxID=293428 RepID=UPI0025DBFC2C|nr:peptidoglycan-binding protein [uncultured Anaerococcus sp.]
MNKKFNIATLMLVTSLAFTGCANDTNKEADKANETAVEQKANETVDQADKTEEKTEESKEGEVKEDKAAEENKEEKAEDEKKENTKTSETPAVEGNIVLHRAYPDEASRSFTTVVVATSGDKIVDAFIDEYQYFGDDEGYQGVPNSDKEFGDGAKEGRILASKIDNKEPYSETMKQAGGEVTLMDNYNAVTDFVKGKTITELEEVLNDDEKIMDAISGATFKSTPNLLRYIVDAAKDNSFIIGGQAENPENIELRYVLGAPHGDKSFANAVVAVEDEKIIAASIDEYQYIEEGVTSQGEGSDFANDYKDSKTVLSSKLENDDLYSKLMAEKAGSTVTIKENFEAIEKFVAGKTIDEIKETIAGAKEGEKVEAVSGATLVDTAGYLQLIVDAFENPINK